MSRRRFLFRQSNNSQIKKTQKIKAMAIHRHLFFNFKSNKN